MTLGKSVECATAATAFAAAMRDKESCIYRRNGESESPYWVLDYAPRFDGADLDRMRIILGLTKTKAGA